MLFRGPLEKDVGAGIDEETNIRRISNLPSAPDTVGLFNCLAEFSIRGKAVLQVAAYGSCVDRQRSRFPDGISRVAITALEINGHRQLCRNNNSAYVVDRQGKRSTLAIGETVGIGYRPTTRRDCLGAGRSHSLGAADIPDVKEHQRLSWNMPFPESLGLARLVGHFRLLMNLPFYCA